MIATEASAPGSAIEGRALRAAIGLLRGDARAVALFDTSVLAFFTSFRAALYALPAFALVLAAERRLIAAAPGFDAAGFSEWRFAGLEMLGFALAWVLGPLVLLALLRIAKVTQRFVPLMIAVNWVNAVAGTIMSLPAVLVLTGLVPDTVVALASLGLLAWMLRYLWFTVKVAGRFDSMMAALLVAGLFSTEILLSQAIDALGYLP